jgi:hypothetical protein
MLRKSSVALRIPKQTVTFPTDVATTRGQSDGSTHGCKTRMCMYVGRKGQRCGSA